MYVKTKANGKEHRKRQDRGTYIVVHTYQNLKTIKEYERQQKYENLYNEFR